MVYFLQFSLFSIVLSQMFSFQICPLTELSFSELFVFRCFIYGFVPSHIFPFFEFPFSSLSHFQNCPFPLLNFSELFFLRLQEVAYQSRDSLCYDILSQRQGPTSLRRAMSAWTLSCTTSASYELGAPQPETSSFVANGPRRRWSTLIVPYKKKETDVWNQTHN